MRDKFNVQFRLLINDFSINSDSNARFNKNELTKLTIQPISRSTTVSNSEDISNEHQMYITFWMNSATPDYQFIRFVLFIIIEVSASIVIRKNHTLVFELCCLEVSVMELLTYTVAVRRLDDGSVRKKDVAKFTLIYIIMYNSERVRHSRVCNVTISCSQDVPVFSTTMYDISTIIYMYVGTYTLVN